MSDVTFKRADYSDAVSDWELVGTVVSGERAVKKQGETLLPNPSTAESNTTEKDAVYDKYKQRSSFFNVCGYTLAGLIGAAFRRAPTVEVPSGLEYVTEDVDGSGLSIYQQSQSALASVLTKGRAPLFVDYPNTDAPVSRAEQAVGNIRPSIIQLEPSQVINWRTTKVGGVHKYSLVVIEESYEEIDGFGSESKKQYRVLQLIENRYVVSIYRADKNGKFNIDQQYEPKNGAGQAWTEIPFIFAGAQNNDWRIDKAPLLDLALLNIKHYQVGADWYNALHWAGQPQPAITGLDQAWRDHMEEKGVVLGSRSPLLLPVGGDYKLASITADTALESEIGNIEERMVAIGARLIQKGGTVKTATEAQNDNETEHSVLSLAAENVSDAYTKALGWMAEFVNTSGEINYELSQDYVEHELDAQMLTALISAWQSGKYPESDLWAQLRKHGMISQDKTDEDIKGELDNDDAGLGFEE